jgi:hypothetical protein
MFVAVIVSAYVPFEPLTGVPDRVAVPLALGVNVTPVGSAPVADSVAVGLPVAVTVKLNGLASFTVCVALDVIAGLLPTTMLKDCEIVPVAFVAVNVIGNVLPAMAVVAVPEKVAVPSAFATKVMPVGSAPDRVTVGAGEPDVVTVKENGTPVTAVAVVALVKVGLALGTGRLSVAAPGANHPDTSPP